MKNEKTRVLQVLGGLYCGGTEAFVMNMYRAIDRKEVQFDFLIHERSKGHYDDEVLALGGTIHRIPDRTEIGTLKYFINLVRELYKIKPDVVHSHGMFNSGVVMFASFLVGIKKRVAHSHSEDDQSGNSYSRRVFRMIMRCCIYLFSTNFVACSDNAAKYLFGTKRVHKNKVEIINNGIDLRRYRKEPESQLTQIRKELKISDQHFVIGMVARLVEVKNPLFIINLLEEVVKKNKNTVFVIVGDGPLRKDIEIKVKQRGLHNYVRLIGNRNDVPTLMSIFNLLVLPSLYEGLSIVTLEAQAKGVPCIVSDNVSTSANLGLNLVKFIPLDDKDAWVNAICLKPLKLKNQMKIQSVFKTKGYDIDSSSCRLLNLYSADT